MSLLLEALKKAELAKQSIRRAPPAPDGSVGASNPVITREALPDITQPLEILSADLPSAPAPARTEPTMALGVGMQVESPRETSAPVEELSSAGPSANPFEDTEPADAGLYTNTQPPPLSEPERAAARQVFEAKEMDYNPRRPFYITMGVLVTAAMGYGGYVWWQLQPKAIYNSAAFLFFLFLEISLFLQRSAVLHGSHRLSG